MHSRRFAEDLGIRILGSSVHGVCVTAAGVTTWLILSALFGPEAGAGDPAPVTADQAVTVLSANECFEHFAVADILTGMREEVPVDVMLLLDHSGSMDDGGDGCTIPGIDDQGDCEQMGGVWGPQPLTSSKEAAKRFVDLLLPNDRAGLVSYGTHATLLQGLTFDHQAVKDGVDTIVAEGFTNIADAIHMAAVQLAADRPEALKVMIVFSDGVANRAYRTDCTGCGEFPCAPTCCTQDAVDEAMLAKDAGQILFGIFLRNIVDADPGCTVQEVEMLGEETLMSVSSGPDQFFVLDSLEGLEEVFAEIAAQLAPSAHDLVLTDEVAPEFRIVAGSIDPVPDSVSGNTIVWSLDSLGTEMRTFSYEVERASELTPAGSYPVSAEARLDYLDPLGEAQTIFLPQRSADLTGGHCACGGQGRATLLVKARCQIGSRNKFKLAGRPFAPYRLYVDHGAGPVVRDGIGTFCLDFSENRELIARGDFNRNGFASVWYTIPEDPGLIGTDLAFQFVSRDREAPGKVAISNAAILPVCGDGGFPCQGGIRRLGYHTLVIYDGGYPVQVTQRAYASGNPGDPIGELSFSYDPANPPSLPIVSDDENLTIDAIDAYPGYVVVHAALAGCGLAGDRLPDLTMFETEVGDSVASQEIDTSCGKPIGPGANRNPIFITSLQDVANAPDCP